MTDSCTSDSDHPLTPRQAHLIGTLRRSRKDWLELWELSQRAGYTVKGCWGVNRSRRPSRTRRSRPL